MAGSTDCCGRGSIHRSFVFLNIINVNVIIIFFILWKISPLSISYCAKYSTIEAINSLTFSLEILKDINCTCICIKGFVLFNFG